MTTKSPSAPSHLPFLDFLRGVAILSVFLFHSVGATYGPTDQLVWHGAFRDFHVSGSFLALLPFTLGWSGVTLFFVISGFCIHLSHERSKDKHLSVFFLRRFFRIYPPFLVACLIFAAIRLNFHAEFWASATDLATHLLLLNNYLSGPGGINGSFWSIATEAQLYLLYPFLLAIAVRWGWYTAMWFTGVVWAAMVLFSIFTTNFYPSIVLGLGYHRSPFSAWYIWTIGAALADAYLKGESLPFRRIPFYVWLILGVGSYFYRPFSTFTDVALALAAVHVIALCLDKPEVLSGTRFPTVFKAVSTVGVVSYSMYLIHQPIMKIILLVGLKLTHKHPPDLVVYGCALATMAVIFPAAHAFYRWIELPSIEVGKWAIQKSKEWRLVRLGTAPSIDG